MNCMCCVNPSLVISVFWVPRVHWVSWLSWMLFVPEYCVSWMLTPAESLAERAKGNVRNSHATSTLFLGHHKCYSWLVAIPAS